MENPWFLNRPALSFVYMEVASLTLLRNLSLSVVCLLFLVSGVAAEETVDRIVAVVNGDIISLFEVERRVDAFLERSGRQEDAEMRKQMERKMLDAMIDDILLRQQAETYQIEVTDIEVDNQLNQQLKQQKISAEAFERSLRSEGMNLEDYKQRIKYDILKHRLVSGMIRRKVVVTEDEIKQYYNEHMDEFTQEKKVGLQLLVLPPEIDALEIRSRISSGELPFADAVKEYSVGPGASSGGNIGELNWNDIAPEWKDALQGVREGEISDPFVLQGHTALLRVTSLQEGSAKPLKDVEEDIANILRQPKLEERYVEYISELKAKAVIDIRM